MEVLQTVRIEVCTAGRSELCEELDINAEELPCMRVHVVVCFVKMASFLSLQYNHIHFLDNLGLISPSSEAFMFSIFSSRTQKTELAL